MRLLPGPGPVRTLSIATLISTVGNGLWMASSALYLTRIVGLSVPQTGLALTTVALIMLVLSTPTGYLADNLGPRGVSIGCLLALGVTELAMLTVHSLPTFLLVAAPMAVFDAAQRSARGAIIGSAVPPDRRVHTRAYLRAVTNVGITVGAGAAGIGLAIGTREAFLAMIVGDAVSFMLAGLALTRLTPVAPVRHTGSGPRLTALRDRPFLVLTVLDGLLAINFGLLEVAMPLWVADRTDAPHWMIAVVVVVNTVSVVLLQVRMSRGADGIPGAARASRRAGFALLAACLIFSTTAHSSGRLTMALLVLAAVAHVIGELWYSAGGWGLSFGLAPEGAHGQYQGTFAMGHQFGQMLAPVVVTALTLGWGTPGWLLLGALFACAGTLVPPVARWAQSSRPALT
ncbi:MFS transporter [Catenuloplanes sp. NPDC051500]|uniref:MFS transporter n=1 Tax=Catenuloplanes sp. NPDC051500 TaxID=3363959 RepID=UPI0037A136B8